MHDIRGDRFLLLMIFCDLFCLFLLVLFMRLIFREWISRARFYKSVYIVLPSLDFVLYIVSGIFFNNKLHDCCCYYNVIIDIPCCQSFPLFCW